MLRPEAQPAITPAMKLTSRYEQTSCRLVLEGLPDLSAGQNAETIGILTRFSLALAGKTEMEGEREHLQAMLAVVLPYARQLLSGVRKPCGNAEQPIEIRPLNQGHQLELRSRQANTPPLLLDLDDAELADLVRCLDRMQLDEKVAVPLERPVPQPLRRSELVTRLPLQRRLAAPLVGISALLISAALASLLPTPKPPANPPTTMEADG
jgi:hypothetical protein